jgi:hypothetical protein
MCGCVIVIFVMVMVMGFLQQLLRVLESNSSARMGDVMGRPCLCLFKQRAWSPDWKRLVDNLRGGVRSRSSTLRGGGFEVGLLPAPNKYDKYI